MIRGAGRSSVQQALRWAPSWVWCVRFACARSGFEEAIDDGFDFCYSLHPNDLVRITLKKETHLGYYASCNRSTGAINLWAHDRNRRVGKEGFIEGIGVKTAVAVEKYHVDTLGNIYPAPPEKRGGLA